MTEDQNAEGDFSIPGELGYSARDFNEEDYARRTIYKINAILKEVSRWIDISNLDGVTIAFDYDAALAELDRGYETSHKLEATKDVAVGVAMAPSVIREGKVKTHLVLNANYILSLVEEEEQKTDFFWQSLHLVAHECAHVEVTAAFDRNFPNVLLQKKHENILDNIRWQVILAAWDEYAVCRIAGTIGYDPSEGYLETFKQVLSNARSLCYEKIKNFRFHGDVGQVACEVYGILGDLVKYSSYYLGSIAEREDTDHPPTNLLDDDEFHWFAPFYEHIEKTHEAIWSQFDSWDDQSNFEALGDILEDMAESVGLIAERESDETIYFRLPYRPETMP